MTETDYRTIYACARSEEGRVRDSNEDAFVVADLTQGIRIEKTGNLDFQPGPYGALFAVADGMGGAAAGEMASGLGLRSVYRVLQDQIREVRQLDDDLLEQIMIDAVAVANRRIFDLGRSREDLSGMGTTLTAALEFQGRLIIGQIGDSRAYLLRRGQIRQLTRDQSLVARRVSLGEITEEEARRDPARNILLQALGVEAEVELALNIVSVQSRDILLLCSDGLHAQMSADEIYDAVVGSRGPEAACRDLVALANQRGGPDNITTVLACFMPE